MSFVSSESLFAEIDRLADSPSFCYSSDALMVLELLKCWLIEELIPDSE